jgi:hypothetical protein
LNVTFADPFPNSTNEYSMLYVVPYSNGNATFEAILASYPGTVH